MKFKNKVNGLAAAVIMSLSVAAQADLITFDPTGTAGPTGNISNVGTFDWLPGSALAVGANSTTGIGAPFTTYFQANLGGVLDGNTNATLFTNGTGSNYFTAVAGFGEKVTTCSGTPCLNATFGFNAFDPVNFFNIFTTSGFGNNLTGAGFTGTSILSGHVIAAGFGSNFALDAPQSSPPQALDQSPNGDQWSGTATVTGTGASKITIMIDSVNSAYFPDLMVGGFITFSPFNTSQVLAFNQVDPSRCMSNGVADCAIASNIGTFNGMPIGFGGGPDVLFQADANQSFKRTIPEPGMLAIFSLGLMGVGIFGRRRSTHKQS